MSNEKAPAHPRGEEAKGSAKGSREIGKSAIMGVMTRRRWILPGFLVAVEEPHKRSAWNMA